MKTSERAEKVIKSLVKKDKWGNEKIEVTTSQLRKFLAGVNGLHNKVEIWELENNSEDDRLPVEIEDELDSLKVKLIYQSGREPKVKYFIEKAEIMKEIEAIQGSKKRFLEFSNYMEALVAYHKFYGGN